MRPVGLSTWPRGSAQGRRCRPVARSNTVRSAGWPPPLASVATVAAYRPPASSSEVIPEQPEEDTHLDQCLAELDPRAAAALAHQPAGVAHADPHPAPPEQRPVGRGRALLGDPVLEPIGGADAGHQHLPALAEHGRIRAACVELLAGGVEEAELARRDAVGEVGREPAGGEADGREPADARLDAPRAPAAQVVDPQRLAVDLAAADGREPAPDVHVLDAVRAPERDPPPRRCSRTRCRVARTRARPRSGRACRPRRDRRRPRRRPARRRACPLERTDY